MTAALPDTSAAAAAPAVPAPPAPAFAFDNSYARDLEGAYVAWPPAAVSAPRLVWLNEPLADELGLDAAALASPAGLAVLSGNAVPAGAQPIAQAYAGHQFGGFSPQLGDGRALLLGEVIDRRGQRRDIAFKGSGRTPFSRGGDGKAALGPVLREVLIGEAMQALGIPTTRALAAVASGDTVWRERPLPGAVLTRVAASHLRVGTFQFFVARQDVALLRRLLAYALRRHGPALPEGTPVDEQALALLRAVLERQARLLAQWLGVGFIHGVMNTDNMTISGETIDYGPCAFLEAHDPATVFSSIDTHGRYAYGNQSAIAHWNLVRLAEALLPLVDTEPERAVPRLSAVLDAYPAAFESHWRAVRLAKLGWADRPADEDDVRLADDYLALLAAHRVDHTLGFRLLAPAAEGAEGAAEPLHRAFADGDADPRTRAEGGATATRAALDAWLARWRARGPSGAALRRANPAVIARNHHVEAALEAATERGDLGPFERLLAALRRPFADDPAAAAYQQPAPREQTEQYRTFCGT